MAENNPIELFEASRKKVPESTIPEDIGKLLVDEFSDYLDIQHPWSGNDHQWIITVKDWVGYLPIENFGGLIINPKINISNFFRMLTYAYRLKSFHFFDEDVFQSNKLVDFYSFLAYKLSQMIFQRKRKGFYKEYKPIIETSPTIRGRIDFNQIIQRPWDINLTNLHEEHTEDIEDNRILAWTTFIISRNHFCKEEILPAIKKASNELKHLVSLNEINYVACIDRFYNRLNNDYEPMHILCRFFLENVSPHHKIGKNKMIPFIVNMPRLFELFVAEWLKQNIPNQYQVVAKKKHYIDLHGLVSIEIDVAIKDRQSQKTIVVLDTKYKAPTHTPEQDIYQISFYAHKESCDKAVLIYPTDYRGQFSDSNVKIHCLPFLLDGDLEDNGRMFVDELLLFINM